MIKLDHLLRRLKPLILQGVRSNHNLKVFEDNATKWWSGKEFKLLRAMNEIRVPFIVDNLNKPMNRECKLLDVGCGGGILSEPLARLGANVLGIDPVFESINQAQLHAQHDQALEDRLRYRNCNIEDLSSQTEHIGAYDGLIASEVLEHIDDVEEFLRHCTKVLKPNGNLFITTINQTPLSWLGVIFFGEYVLQQLPKGTHQYEMFVSVKALRIMLERLGYHVRLINGFMYEPVGGKFHWTPTTLTHYALHAIKCDNKPKFEQKSPNIQHEQRRYMKKSSTAKLNKPKKSIDRDELMLVIPLESYEARADNIVSELSDHLDRTLTIRASTSSVEKLKIRIDGLDETLELRDIAQIGLKGSQLIVINLSTMPNAIKPTLEALKDMESFNPQVEVNNIYLQVPRVTREHRERLAADAKRAANKAKDALRSLFSEFASKAKNSSGKRGVSEDLVKSGIENLRYDVDKRLASLDSLLESRSSQLLNMK